ncbi:MAG: multiple sugar transport system permease protein [Candidatus Atribacteria bacterium]|nr:multiple sugar transport system permease protein [Candidatus Atribacteria bacterium]
MKGYNYNRLLPYVLLLPTFILVALVAAYPIIVSLIYSLSKMRYLKFERFVGLENYVRIMGDQGFWQSLSVSLKYYGLSIAIVIPLGLLLATLLSSKVKFLTLFRTIIFLPWVLSQTITALIWGWLLNENFGPILWIFSKFGNDNISFLSDVNNALPLVVLANVWNSCPFAIIFLMSAIQSIPEELNEAAKIDGANTFQKFNKITLPLIMPTLSVVFIQLTLLYFNMVTLIFVMTGGGPLGSTSTLSLYTFQHAFQFWNTSYAAALTFLLLVINLLFAGLYVRLFRVQY